MTAPTTAGQRGDIHTAVDTALDRGPAPATGRARAATAAAGRKRERFSRRTRNALVTVHVAASVALLGDVLGLAAVTLEARGTADPESARALHEIMSTFSLTFGIPFSFTALVTGIALGLGTRWGVLRSPWVAAKLALTLVVIVAGAVVVGPAEGVLVTDPLSEPARSAAEQRVLAGAAVQILALLGAVALSVYKPGRTRAPAAR